MSSSRQVDVHIHGGQGGGGRDDSDCCMTDAEINGEGCFLCSGLRPWRGPISEGTLAMPSVSFPATSCERKKVLSQPFRDCAITYFPCIRLWRLGVVCHRGRHMGIMSCFSSSFQSIPSCPITWDQPQTQTEWALGSARRGWNLREFLVGKVTKWRKTYHLHIIVASPHHQNAGRESVSVYRLGLLIEFRLVSQLDRVHVLWWSIALLSTWSFSAFRLLLMSYDSVSHIRWHLQR